MSTQILINATYPEEVRVAIKKGKELINYDNDRLDNINKKGCIFKGIVSRVEPSLDAAFIDFGRAKHGFLPLSEVMKSHQKITASKDLEASAQDSEKKDGIASYLKEGQSVIVQVEKDERGTKGAALTTNISLAGCFVVLMPNTAGAGGISRQIEGEQRDQLKRILNQIDVPSSHSLILRTASVEKTLEELLWDYNVLISQWAAISQAAEDSSKPLLLYKEGALLPRTIRDFLKPGVEAIYVDQKETFNEVMALVQNARPDFIDKVKLYEDDKKTLFDAFEVEYDVESLYNSEITMSNGATLVIDHCEALTAIDINSAKATKSSDIDETAFNINKAAAYEIARQIRLRNLGGQIVIDFIDMSSDAHRKEVEEIFEQAVEEDKARIQIGRICPKLSLLTLSRQRMNTSLDESSLIKCQHCHGHGVHRRLVSVALSLLRLLKSQASREKTDCPEYILKTNSQIAELLYNKYKKELSFIEEHYRANVLIKIDSKMGAADFEIETRRKASASTVYRNFEKNTKPSEEEILIPAVKAVTNRKNNPDEEKKEQASFFSRLYQVFFGSSAKKNETTSHYRGKKRPAQARGKSARGPGRNRPSVNKSSSVEGSKSSQKTDSKKPSKSKPVAKKVSSSADAEKAPQGESKRAPRRRNSHRQKKPSRSKAESKD